MAWTDYTTTLPADWSADIGSNVNSSVCMYDHRTPVGGDLLVAASTAEVISRLSNSYNIPGFDDGYQPDGVSDPIQGDLGGGSGGGSTRPSSGFLYPRGQG